MGNRILCSEGFNERGWRGSGEPSKTLHGQNNPVGLFLPP